MAGLGDVRFWLNARCSPARHAVLPVKALWDDYKAWCAVRDADPVIRKRFVRELGRIGVRVEMPDARTGEPRPYTVQGRMMAGGVQFKHDPVPLPVPRVPWKRVGPSGPTGPKRLARWKGTGSVEDAAQVGEWVDACCDRRVWAEVPLTEAYADYELWAEGVDGGEAWHRRGFVILLRALGFKTRRVAGQVRVMGLLLAPGRPTAPREPRDGSDDHA